MEFWVSKIVLLCICNTQHMLSKSEHYTATDRNKARIRWPIITVQQGEVDPRDNQCNDHCRSGKGKPQPKVQSKLPRMQTQDIYFDHSKVHQTQQNIQVFENTLSQIYIYILALFPVLHPALLAVWLSVLTSSWARAWERGSSYTVW